VGITVRAIDGLHGLCCISGWHVKNYQPEPKKKKKKTLIEMSKGKSIGRGQFFLKVCKNFLSGHDHDEISKQARILRMINLPAMFFIRLAVPINSLMSTYRG
jgi:hypothetical protein